MDAEQRASLDLHIGLPGFAKVVRACARRVALDYASVGLESEDVEQEIWAAALVARARIDPKRGRVRGFLWCVVRNAVRDAIRSARRCCRGRTGGDVMTVSEECPRGFEEACGVWGNEGRSTGLDVQTLITGLEPDLARVARSLMTSRPEQIGHEMGISRSGVYRHIDQLRARFAVLDPRRRVAVSKKERLQ